MLANRHVTDTRSPVFCPIHLLSRACRGEISAAGGGLCWTFPVWRRPNVSLDHDATAIGSVCCGQCGGAYVRVLRTSCRAIAQTEYRYRSRCAAVDLCLRSAFSVARVGVQCGRFVTGRRFCRGSMSDITFGGLAWFLRQEQQAKCTPRS